MALNFKQSFGNKGTLPEFRGGSEMVQGLQSVGAEISVQKNPGQGSDYSYMDVNKFENNWDDLDDDFSKQDVLDIEYQVPSKDDDVRYRYSFGTKPSIKSSGLQRTLFDEELAVIRHEPFDKKHRSTIEIRQSSKKNDKTEITSSNDNFILKPQPSHEGQGHSSVAELSPVDTNDVPVKVENTGLRKRSHEKTEAAQTFDQLFVRSDQSDAGGSIGCCGYILWFLSILLIIITFPFSLCLSIKVVQEYERAVIFRLGRLVSGGAKGPGLFFIIPCIDSYTKVDLRTVSFDVPPQEVLTKDSVTVAVDAVVYYRIQNATMSITNVEDSNRSTRLLAATTLRNVLGTKNLSEILSDRESISHVMQTSLDDATDPWGVKVERVEVKDVRLPVQLQRAMAAEAEAAREARAKVIAAEGEQKASRALKEAADVMAESPAAIQLRYLQTLNTISAEKNSTIIFPLPVDLMQAFMRKSGVAGESAQSHF